MSDANGLRFHMLADREAWQMPSDELRWDGRRRSLRLAGRRSLPEPVSGGDPPADHVDVVPQALDDFGSRAFWGESARAVRVVSDTLPGTIDLFTPEADETPTDLTTGGDGVLYIALGRAVVLVDLRDRWDPVRVEAPATTPLDAWRLATDRSSDATVDVWALDRTRGRLGKLRGQPLPRRPYAPFAPTTWRPRPENADAPTLLPEVEVGFATGEVPVGIAASPDGRLAVLSWGDEADGGGRLRLFDSGTFQRTLELGRERDSRLAFPFSAAWLDEERVAVLAPGLAEAAVYRVGEPGRAAAVPGRRLPVGDPHPLSGHDGGPFLHGRGLPPHYPRRPGDDDSASAPLHRLSLPSFATRGEAAQAPAPFDSGRDGAVWHRLYLEAAIPEHCSVEVQLAASDDPDLPDPAFFTHHFGAAPPADRATPRGAWVPHPSEIPFAPSLVACEPIPGRTGLFTVLIQRPGHAVRSLRGRYLSVRVALAGNGRRTPEVAAVRAYASRFSYVENYLPELYHETLFGPAGDVEGESTAPDFLERMVNNFEGILTPLEDRVASAHLLTDADGVPAESLEWLGSWIAADFEPALSTERRRALLRATPELQRWHGTVRGLRLALDVATGGAVAGGEIVLVEGFRLRRTFATILGADLADLEDPLLPGLTVSGNSFVGDTLILGEEHQEEFLALFRADLPLDSRERAEVAAFFARLAHRVTVLVHERVEPEELGVIAQVVERSTPAHVEAEVLQASLPFLIGIASLVGVDSYLGLQQPLRPVELGRSYVGGGDRIQRPPALDPRLIGDPNSNPPAQEDNP